MVTRSLLHPKYETFGSKIAPSATTVTASSSSVASRGAHKTVAGLAFGAHNGLKCHPMKSKCLIGHIHTSCHAQTMESLVLLWDNSHFSMLTSSFLHPECEPLWSKLALSATTVTASSPSVANRGAHKTLAGLVFQAHNGLKCNPMSSKVSSDTFIPHVMPRPWSNWFYLRKTNTF